MVLSHFPIRYFLVFVLLIIASAKDIYSKTIPNWCIIALAALCLPRLGEGDSMLKILSGCTPTILIFIVLMVTEGVTGRKAMGRGDVKLLFVLGLHYEIVEMLYIILISCIITIVYYLLFLRDKKQGVALCPMISISVIIITLVRWNFA